MITSAVEMMKVTVEMRTMESEKRARNWARFEVQGYLNIELKSSISILFSIFTQLCSTASCATCPTQCYRNPPQPPEKWFKK